jgi:hypothetical protein
MPKVSQLLVSHFAIPLIISAVACAVWILGAYYCANEHDQHQNRENCVFSSLYSVLLTQNIVHALPVCFAV